MENIYENICIIIFKCIIFVFYLDGIYTHHLLIINLIFLFVSSKFLSVIMFHCSRKGTFNYLESHVCQGTRLTGDSTIEQEA